MSSVRPSIPPPAVIRQTREFVNNGGNADEVVDCRTTFCEHLDAMGVRAGREYVTLVVRDMREDACDGGGKAWHSFRRQ